MLLHDTMFKKVGVIFRPYGRKSTVIIRYFPSLRTEFTAKFRYFPSVRTENSEIQLLISVLADGNQALNFAVFRPYEQMAPHYCPK